MIDKIRLFFAELRAEYDEFMWKYSEDRMLLAKNRLEAHRVAMAEGKNSPYTHPEEYDNFF